MNTQVVNQRKENIMDEKAEKIMELAKNWRQRMNISVRITEIFWNWNKDMKSWIFPIRCAG